MMQARTATIRGAACRRQPSLRVLPLFSPQLLCLLPLVGLLMSCASVSQDQLYEQAKEFNSDGVYLFQKGDYAQARECFEVALQRKPEDPALLYNIGQCYDRLGQTKKAEEIYRECLHYDAHHAPSRHALHRLLMLDGRRSEAAETIETWLTAQPQNANAYVEDAWRWQQDGDLLKAQGRLQQALKLDPHNVRALTQMGILYELLERPDRALVLYKEALIEAPTRTDLAERIRLLQARGVKAPLPD